MKEKLIYTAKDGSEIFAVSSEKIPVMLDTKEFTRKPSKPETAGIKCRIATAFSEVGIEELADVAGNKGRSFVPALLDGNGTCSNNWTQQQIFCLDFDENFGLHEFEARCKSLEIFPAFVYFSFSHSPAQDKFRTVFVLDHIVTNERLRKLVVGLLFALFPERDEQCVDASRLYYGGKGIHSKNFEQRLNPINLLTKFARNLKQRDKTNFARSLTKFCTEHDLERSRSNLGVNSHGYLPNFEENLDPSLLYKERSTNSSISRVIHERQIFEINWVEGSGQKSKRKKHQSSKGCPRASKLKPDDKPRLLEGDLALLESKCQLFHEFHFGIRRLGNKERRILLSNLRWFRNGMALYKAALKHFDHNSGFADPYPHNDSELIDCANFYDFKPESCSNCPYNLNCEHEKNLLRHLKLKRNSCRKIGERKNTITLAAARDKVDEALHKILFQSKGGTDISILKADCGVGKTEALIKLLPKLDHVCIAFPTHRLAQEAFERLRQMGHSNQYFLWRDRPKLPGELQSELDASDRLGLANAQQTFERALEHPDVKADSEWKNEIRSYLKAHREIFTKTRIFCTHEKALQIIERKSDLIHTFIFDEDPMKSIFKIHEVSLTDIQTVLKRLGTGETKLSAARDRLEAVLSTEKNKIAPTSVVPIDRDLLGIELKESGISSPVGSLMDCTGYIIPQSEHLAKTAESAFTVSWRSLPDQYKYLIMTATPIFPLYEQAFGERLRLVDIPAVELQGKLHIHAGKGYSKTSVREMGSEFVDFVQESVEKFKLDGIITYKECAVEENSNLVLKGSERPVPVFATFGATEGFNAASGKRIGVIGTPRLPDHALKLYGHAVGVAADRTEFEFKFREVRRHEFEASIYCASDHQFFQELELSIGERELGQAVGRARLLENDTEVHLFSSYAIPGGELWDRRN